MIVLILTICSLSSPDRCGEVRLPFAEPLSAMQCLLQAPPHLAAYVDEHPDIRVAAWRCAVPTHEDRPT